ncbi:sensor histidine kinase [Salinibacterium sp. M195]|uniref:sensor histidine kinase n=1 Tax=Salinibacterium sp. M195 TaxID=2583374 RepID=UPI001C62BC8C|nr:ATP-binding protein [Salinibacterium sp. M195]QYH34491.1 ATP-binding protein [Salinibacterium sp. M195]
MSIGLPAHLRKESVSRAFARTVNAVALVCLSLALVGVVSVDVADADKELFPAALALVPLLVTVILVNRYRTIFFSVAHIFIGGPAAYWFFLTVYSQMEPLGAVGQYLVNLPNIALMLVGGSGASALWGALWCTAGLIVAESAVALASWQLTGTVNLDMSTFAVYIAVLVVLATLRLSQRGVRRVQSNLHRAARDDEFANLRYGIEATSAAVMHDTVLGHLAAIANAPFGAMSPQLQREIKRDLEVLVGEEWLSEAANDASDSVRSDWQKSALLTAITEARAMELEVEITGDLTSLSLLDSRGAAALGPAVKQCLVNVIKHSGVMQAEVAIFASPAEVSVLVVDAGKGFDEAETGADRLGLRQSVRRRMELVEGTVQVWSTPGLGTSVMIRVPVPDRQPALSVEPTS